MVSLTTDSLGGAQIDPYGNLNSVTIGEHDHPKARLPGSGGGNDVGSQCWRTVAIMQHDKRRFVPKVDFLHHAWVSHRRESPRKCRAASRHPTD